MTFTTNIFLIGLLPWCLLLIYLTRKLNQVKCVLLVLANIVFYIWGGVGAFAFICVFSVGVWIITRLVYRVKNKLLLALSIMITVLPLALVKYTSFVISNINSLCGSNIEFRGFLMPIGISFFTFEAISLIVDTHKGEVEDKVSLLRVYLYLSFFPTVTSGPIVRYNTFQDGLANAVERVEWKAAERIVIGLGKKVLIADKLSVLADYYFNGVAAGNDYSCVGLWIGSVAYTLQLYFDFSGYSDMAIGIGELLGFHIPENFNAPYRANSISDFWRRWHISLSRWFRDYVYISLGGNRCKPIRHVLNLFVVWLLTGIWHGADWSFVLWGLGYFVLLFAEKYITVMKKIGDKWFGHVYALFFINLLWVLFRADNMSVAGRYLAGMFGANGIGAAEDILMPFIPFVLVACTLCLPWEKILSRVIDNGFVQLVREIAIIAIAAIAICAVVNASYTPYIYGNF